MAVRMLDDPVFAVGDKLGSLVDAHPTPRVQGFFFGLVVAAGPLGVFAFDIPPAVRVGDNMMLFSRHGPYPLCALGQQVLQPSASE